MADIFQILSDQWQVVKPALRVIAVVAVVSAGVGWWFADYHYGGRIDELKETLENKQFPAPVVRTVTVTVKDQKQAQAILELQGELDEAHRTIQELGRPSAVTPAVRPRRAPSGGARLSGATTSVNQSGGVTQGSGGTIGTVNQNALPARSAFAASLGNLYTDGYLILQRLSVLNLSDAQLSDLGQAVDSWRNKVINWMNSNMCSDAAAYFLKAHRAGMTYGGLSPKQNNLLDLQSWSLDNLSDIKRNDAWDCK